jgi:hypothetical protein
LDRPLHGAPRVPHDGRPDERLRTAREGVSEDGQVRGHDAAGNPGRVLPSTLHSELPLDDDDAEKMERPAKFEVSVYQQDCIDFF